jgi:glycosyltransferase involved in cell wall biosynthesis
MPAIRRLGHEVALWHEVDTPDAHPPLPVPDSAPIWSVSRLGVSAAVANLREWRPDVLYAHGLLDPAIERRALDVAPAVFFAHDYYGTCISGLKALSRPVVTPCSRTFGWRCLAEYYPRRCGGLSPVTMVRQFRLQHDRLSLLSRYAAIVTHSSHMRQEYVRHGFPPARVFNVGYGQGAGPCGAPEVGNGRRGDDEPWRLLFVGRMDRLKGGSELIRALPEVSRRLARPLHLTFAGDGQERSSWEARAAEVCRLDSRICVEFQGWTGPEARDGLYERADLLVVPSLWPEPLGLVGIEAARHSLPAVAFDVGGISDWLMPGANGVLAPGDPPTVQGLADAVVAALGDPTAYARLRDGALRMSAGFSFDTHLRLLFQVFGEIVH